MQSIPRLDETESVGVRRSEIKGSHFRVCYCGAGARLIAIIVVVVVGSVGGGSSSGGTREHSTTTYTYSVEKCGEPPSPAVPPRATKHSSSSSPIQVSAKDIPFSVPFSMPPAVKAFFFSRSGRGNNCIPR